MKNRTFLIYIISIIFLYVFNIMLFFIYTNDKLYPFKNDINCYSFWEYSTHNGLLTIFMFLLPIAISIITIKSINTKIKGSYFRNYIIRDNYKKRIFIMFGKNDTSLCFDINYYFYIRFFTI